MAKLPSTLTGARIVGERFVHSQRQQNPEGRMPLMDHIRELRNRIVKALIALAAGMVIGLVFFHPVWSFITRPYCRAVGGCDTSSLGHTLAVTSPLDGFYLHIKVAFVVGVIVTSPVWLYQIWAFVAPGLYAREKRWTYIFLGTAVPLFLAGITLCYWSLGRSMHYLLGLTPATVGNYIQVDAYMSFVMAMMLAFGLAFEVPLLIIMLNMAGILTHERFRKWRRVMIFGVFLIAGMANPSPDPITMLILGGGCVVLIEVAEFIVWRHDRRKARLHPDPYAGLADDELSPLDLDEAGTRDSRLN
jgi:sec-independent protein translocase protein TatC